MVSQLEACVKLFVYCLPNFLLSPVAPRWWWLTQYFYLNVLTFINLDKFILKGSCLTICKIHIRRIAASLFCFRDGGQLAGCVIKEMNKC